jgi:hypothetical protein
MKQKALELHETKVDKWWSLVQDMVVENPKNILLSTMMMKSRTWKKLGHTSRLFETLHIKP